MKPRVALATYGRAPTLAPDDQPLVPALASLGVEAEPLVWASKSAMWTAFDAVVIRSCWDYHLQSAAFHAWLSRLEESGIPVWNSASLVRWNSNKRYLIDLAQRGVPTIQTTVVPHRRAEDVERIVAAEEWARFVIKPAISASGFETYALETPLSATSRATVARVAAAGDVLVQPFANEIPRDGELSFMFIEGEYSHAALKRATAGEFRVQTDHGGSVESADPDPVLIEQATRSLSALPEVPLYARVDGIVRGGTFLLMELELIEPNLFFDLAPGSVERMAGAIARRLGV